jgi:hypothetical protein
MAAIALLTEDVSHGGPTGVRTLLQGLGHTVTLLADTSTSATVSGLAAYDLVVFVRASYQASGATLGTLVHDLLTSGKPVLFGYVRNGSDSNVWGDVPTVPLQAAGLVEVVNAGVTGLGRLYVPYAYSSVGLTAGNYQIANATEYCSLVVPYPLSGALTLGYMTNSTAAGADGPAWAQPVLQVWEVGTKLVDGSLLASRCAHAGFLYGRAQTSLTTDGANILSSLIAWLLGAGSGSGGAKVTGTVKTSAGAGLSRTVRAYRHDTGALVGTATSDASTGAFEITVPNTQIDVVADGSTADTQNSKILARVVPTPT